MESHPITRVVVAVHCHHTVESVTVTVTSRITTTTTIITTTTIEGLHPFLRGTLAVTDLLPTIVTEAFLPEDGNGTEEGVLRLGGITIDATGITTLLPIIFLRTTAIILLLPINELGI